MAASGLILFFFVIGHLLGNLQMFLGPDKINTYSQFLKNLGELLWVARITLLAAVAIHIVTAVSLTLENRAARPVAYANKKYVKASYASRTMAVSGTIVLAFIIYHLLQFTLMVTHPGYQHLVDAKGRHDVYSMVVMGFSNPVISAWYILSVFLLCAHLSHGIYSALQSLGFHTETSRAWVSLWGSRFAWLLFIGYASIPLSVLLGIIKPISGGLP